MGRGAPVCWILQQRLAKDCVLALAGWAEVLVTGRASCLCLANLILDGHTANACNAIQVDCACPWAQILLGKSCPCPKPQLSTTVFLYFTAGKPGHFPRAGSGHPLPDHHPDTSVKALGSSPPCLARLSRYLQLMCWTLSSYVLHSISSSSQPHLAFRCQLSSQPCPHYLPLSGTRGTPAWE